MTVWLQGEEFGKEWNGIVHSVPGFSNHPQKLNPAKNLFTKFFPTKIFASTVVRIVDVFWKLWFFTDIFFVTAVVMTCDAVYYIFPSTFPMAPRVMETSLFKDQVMPNPQ